MARHAVTWPSCIAAVCRYNLLLSVTELLDLHPLFLQLPDSAVDAQEQAQVRIVLQLYTCSMNLRDFPAVHFDVSLGIIIEPCASLISLLGHGALMGASASRCASAICQVPALLSVRTYLVSPRLPCCPQLLARVHGHPSCQRWEHTCLQLTTCAL
jgi:hypothetical protein